MEKWVAIFIVVTAVAVVIQMGVLVALFVLMRRTTTQMNRVLADLQTRLGPILSRMQILLDDAQPRISSMVNDASHIVYLARNQVQKVDRVFTDATDRLRGQINNADRILTGALESLEDAGIRFRRGFWGPVQKASALVQGIKVGLDFFRSRRRNEPARDPSEHEDELFI